MNISKQKFFVVVFLSFCFMGFTGFASDKQNETTFENNNIKMITNYDFVPSFTLKNKYDNRIKSPLPQILYSYYTDELDQETFDELAKSKDIESKNFCIKIVLEFFEEAYLIENADTFIEKYNIEAIHIGSDYIKGFVPINNIISIAENHSEIERIRTYSKPSKKAVTSEGFLRVGASTWHTAGYTGQGIKVAIIDDGFEHINSLITSGDFKSGYHGKDFTGYGFPSIDDHGTECAAIIFDFAPDAEYYLINVDDESDVKDATNYCITNGVNVISMSLGWDNYYYGDGKGELCDIVNNARNNGILWVNCSGNEGRDCYWCGNYNDSDSDDWLNFSGTDEGNTIYINAGQTVFIELTWDGSLFDSDQDYDMYLFDSYSNQVDYSENLQDGNFQAYEYMVYTPMYSGYFSIGIYNYLAAGTSSFRLFVNLDYELEYGDSSRSITVPADASGSFSVGGIDEIEWAVTPAIIEDYSSQGPTSDGRVKPDICAPDGTSEQYLSGYFYGTSASAPHVAGAAALYWSSKTSYNYSQVRNFLQNTAIDCGTSGKDNIFGYGKLDMSSVPLPDDNYEPNETASLAYDLSSNEGIWLDTINGMGNQVNDDWYKITVNQGFTRIKVECTFDNSKGNIDIELRDKDGNPFTPYSGSSVGDSTTDNEIIECDVSTFGTYYIRVYNENKGNEYNLKWETCKVPPCTPNGFIVDKTGNSRVFLIWDEVVNADKYVVEQAQSDTGPWTMVYEGVEDNYVDSDLKKNTTYWYRLKAVNNLGESAWSPIISGTTTNNSSGSGFCGMIDSNENANYVQFISLCIFILSLVLVRVYKRNI